MIGKRAVLKEVLNDNILVPQKEEKIINFKETDKEATLKNAFLKADGFDYILLRPDKVRGLNSLFKSGKGQLKNCDYILLLEKDDNYFSVFIELKSGSPREEKYLQQFKGSGCLLEYIGIVLKNLYNESHFLKILKKVYRSS